MTWEHNVNKAHKITSYIVTCHSANGVLLTSVRLLRGVVKNEVQEKIVAAKNTADFAASLEMNEEFLIHKLCANISLAGSAGSGNFNNLFELGLGSFRHADSFVVTGGERACFAMFGNRLVFNEGVTINNLLFNQPSYYSCFLISITQLSILATRYSAPPLRRLWLPLHRVSVFPQPPALPGHRQFHQDGHGLASQARLLTA